VPDLFQPPVPAELCLRLGQIVTRWTMVEKMVSLLLGTTLLADQAALSVLSNSISISTQSKWIKVLLSNPGTDQAHSNLVIDLLSRADDLRQERNELVHGVWDSTSCEPQTSLVETINIDRTEIIRSRLVTAHDLDDLLRDIDIWLDDYVALGRELNFPRQRDQTRSMFAD
jgi:hypothetical protein